MDEQKYRRYVISTLCFGFVAAAALLFGIHAVLAGKGLFLILIIATIIYVALDNFFCGTRARRCGIKTRRVYMVPPFLKR